MYKIQYYLSKIIKKLRFSSISNSFVHSTSKIESGSSFVNSSMKRHSFCGYDCDIYCADIGSFTSIASGVIVGGARHPMEWLGMSPVFYKGRDSIRKKFTEYELSPVERVTVGSDVWIGRNAIVLPGVNIGDGAVVGAGAVVTKTVPPYGIVVGNPAKVIKFRFEENIANFLIESRWWDMKDSEIDCFASMCRDPELVIKNMKNKLKLFQ